MQWFKIKKTAAFFTRFYVTGKLLKRVCSAAVVNLHIDFSGRVLLRLCECSTYALQTLLVGLGITVS